MARSISDIIDAHGASRIARTIGVKPGRVRMWKRRSRIPPEYWMAVADSNFSTLEELASASSACLVAEAA